MSVIHRIQYDGLSWLNELDVAAWLIDQALQLDTRPDDDPDTDIIDTVAAAFREAADALLAMEHTPTRDPR